MPLFAPAPIRGSATLNGAGGNVTVSDASARTTSLILITYTKANTVSMGSPTITTKADGSFTVQSTNILDSSTFDYAIFN